ncbi:MAG: hypothetical protein V1844_24850 [Pseudomonadota bacterium]
MKYLIGGGIAAVLFLLAGIGIPYFLSKKAPQDIQKQTSGTPSTKPVAEMPKAVKNETSSPEKDLQDVQKQAIVTASTQPIAAKSESAKSEKASPEKIPQDAQKQTSVTPSTKPAPIHDCAGIVTLFDNWNTGGCGTTNTARGRLSNKALVTQIVFWSDSSIAKGSINGTLQGPGISLPIITMRGSCQWSWCAEIVQLKKILPAGEYTFRANIGSLCQNAESGGIGYIRMEGCVQP